MVHEKKKGDHRAFFQLQKEIGYFRVNFVRVCVAIATNYVLPKLTEIERRTSK